MFMEIDLINENLLSELHRLARGNDRKRQNFDLRTTPEDTSQRMLNVLESGTRVPVHRHDKTAETVICIRGKLDEVFYEDENGCKEIARYTLCPAEGSYGIQIPQGVWHTVEVYEPSVIFEAKDGAYGK
jgi:cupin fold WbuC family metalloprotein